MVSWGGAPMGSDGLYPGKGVAMVMDGEGAAPGGPAGARRARGRALEAACLAAPPAVLVAAVLAGGAWAVPALAVAAASVGLVLAGTERSASSCPRSRSRPPPRRAASSSPPCPT